jgi:hypothetical protein
VDTRVKAPRGAWRIPGGAATHNALCLAWFGLSLSFWAGCRGRPAAAVPLRTVRLEALLPLHPAWRQALLLQREAQQFRESRPRPDGIVLELPGLPSNFASPQKVPQSLIDERRNRLKQEAARYVDSFAEQLAARNNAIYDQEARAGRADLEATYQRQLAARRKVLQDEADRRAAMLLVARERLQYRLIALRSQISAYTEQARIDAVAQRDRIRQDVARIDSERLALLDAVGPEAIKQMVKERERMEAELAQRLAARKRELDQDLKDQTARELARLTEMPDPIPAIGSTPPPARYLHETPLPLPTQQQTLQAVQAAQALVDARAAAKQPALQAQQARLIALIRDDTMQAVEQIARQRGWKLVPYGTRGAIDATATAATAIREQWKLR